MQVFIIEVLSGTGVRCNYSYVKECIAVRRKSLRGMSFYLGSNLTNEGKLSRRRRIAESLVHCLVVDLGC